MTKKVIPSIYKDVTAIVKAEMVEAAKSGFAATTDMWSSRSTQSYLTYTVHWISDDFILKTRCLQV